MKRIEAVRLTSALDIEFMDELRQYIPKEDVPPEDVYLDEPTIYEAVAFESAALSPKDRPDNIPLLIHALCKTSARQPAWDINLCRNLPMSIANPLSMVCSAHLKKIVKLQKENEKKRSAQEKKSK